MKTLPEILNDLSVASYYKGKGNRGINLEDEIQTATTAIVKELMGCLPEKYDVKSELDVGSEFSTPRLIRQNGFNAALDEVRARLTAFIGKEK